LNEEGWTWTVQKDRSTRRMHTVQKDTREIRRYSSEEFKTILNVVSIDSDKSRKL